MLTTNCNIEEFKKVSGIYYIINLITHRKYIGSSTNLYSRWRDHSYKTSNKELQRDIIRFGISNFMFKIVDWYEMISIDKLMQIEDSHLDQYYAKEYVESNRSDRRFRELLYNVMPISNGVFYREYTEEQIESRRERFKGDKNPLFGKKRSQSCKDKMLKTMSEKRQTKPVYSFNITTKEVNSYFSIRDAERKTKVFRSQIIKILKGNQLISNNYYFSLLEIKNIEETFEFIQTKKKVNNEDKKKTFKILNVLTNEVFLIRTLKEVAIYCGCNISNVSKQMKNDKLLRGKFKITYHDN